MSKSIVSGLVVLADASVFFVTGLVIYLIHLGWSDQHTNYLSALAIGTLSLVQAFHLARLYRFNAIIHPGHQLRRIVVVSGIVFLAMLAGAFALKISDQFSRVWGFSWFLSGTLLILAVRICFYLILRQSALAGKLTRNVVIVGWGEQAKRLQERLDHVREPWIRIVGIFDDRAPHRLDRTKLEYPVLGTVKDLLEYARTHRVDDVIVTLPWSAGKRLSDIYDKLNELPVDFHLGSDIAGFMFHRWGYSSFGGAPLLDIGKRPLRGWRTVVKEVEDKVLATLFVVVLSPLFLLIALAIKLNSHGPVIFRQSRYGFNNKVFSVFKFRTMYHNGNDTLELGLHQARPNDPRVTRVGAFLRRTSLDELPQLFNVLQGTMSLVGPRPHPVPLNQKSAEIIDGYYGRHRVKPGITGWAQVTGHRGETELPEKMKARVEQDIHYIENWSLWFDLKILARTAHVLLTQKNAY